jgi:SAM-dependent methyltransferase
MILADAERLVASVPHWHHQFEIFPGLTTPGSYNPNFLLEKLCLPLDLRGLRTLDIGASDGFFSRELFQRGADVTSVDYRDKSGHGFDVMEKLSGNAFDYHQLNVYDIDPKDLGQFDIVLFLGVLYHLPDMMRALFVLRSVSRGTIYIETHCENEFCPAMPAARYYVDRTLNNDWTNFWAPNRLCLLGMLYDAGFDVLHEESWETRMFVKVKPNPDPIRLRKMNTAYGIIK